MRLKLPFYLIAFLPIASANAQDVKAFAVTGQAAKNFNWTDIRQVNLQSGEIERTVFENGISKFSFVNVAGNTPVTQLFLQPLTGLPANGQPVANQTAISPTSFMSAAAAYDKKHSKLFFAAMRSNQLMWLDLSQDGAPAFFTSGEFLLTNPDAADERLNITRMTIGADGNGYAITNDGSHVIRFITGKKVIVTDLGSLKDATGNNGISIHNQCSSWGGDVVADAFGKLHLFTATKNVFEIDLNTLIATYKGAIADLPAAYTLNGAAVIDDHHVMVSSANTFEGFFSVEINSLSAKKLAASGQIFNASDLASCNLLKQTEKQNSFGVAELISNEATGNNMLSVYPNPVTNGQFKVAFEKSVSGKYRIDLTDLQGRLVESRVVYVKLPGQTENMRLQRKHATGLYTIKVTDGQDKMIYSDKLIVN